MTSVHHFGVIKWPAWMGDYPHSVVSGDNILPSEMFAEGFDFYARKVQSDDGITKFELVENDEEEAKTLIQRVQSTEVPQAWCEEGVDSENPLHVEPLKDDQGRYLVRPIVEQRPLLGDPFDPNWEGPDDEFLQRVWWTHYNSQRNTRHFDCDETMLRTIAKEENSYLNKKGKHKVTTEKLMEYLGVDKSDLGDSHYSDRDGHTHFWNTLE